jgi:aspartate/methionine/tyrosine aminotransferase
MVDDFKIQQWLFDTAWGGFDFDLAASHLGAPQVRDLTISADWELDYIDPRGIVALRTVVADLYSPDLHDGNVLIANGAQEALYLFYRSFLSPGEHVIATIPGWQQAWEIPRETGADVSTVTWTPGLPLDIEWFEREVRPETRLISLISPGNPSGRPIEESEWRAIVELAGRRGIWLLVDEEFETNLRTSVINDYPRAVSVSGLSKIHGMPGLRVGWAATASAEGTRLIERMLNYKRYTTMCNSSISEHIAVAVLRDRARYLRRYRESLAEGRKVLDAFVARTADVLSFVPPEGTPFAWFNVPRSMSSAEFARRLLEECRIVVMPAEVFGTENGFRLTYARPNAMLEPALGMVEDLLRRTVTDKVA